MNTDSRLIAAFNGYTADNKVLFTNTETSKYMLADPDKLTGASILTVGAKYKLRQLPGEHYIVEEAV